MPITSSGKWLKAWGPPKLKKIIEQLQGEADARQPIPGLGIEIDNGTNGREISTKPTATSASEDAADNGTGGGSSGTPSDIYGSLNGQPAVFHLLQSSAPTLVTPP